MSTTAVNASPAPSDMDSHEGVAPNSVLQPRVCCPLITLPALSLVLSPESGHSAHRSCHPSLSLLPGGTTGNVCISHHHLVLSVLDSSCAVLPEHLPTAPSAGWASAAPTLCLLSFCLERTWDTLSSFSSCQPSFFLVCTILGLISPFLFQLSYPNIKWQSQATVFTSMTVCIR